MSVAFYTRLQNTADRLIRDKGKPIVITQSSTTYPGYAVEGFIKMQDARLGAETLQEATLVRQSSRLLTASAKGLGVTPEAGDTLTFGNDSVPWRIIGALPLDPGGVIVYWSLAVVR